MTATSSASQMARIKASGATVLVIFQIPTPTVRSIATGRALGFNPDQIYMNSVSAFRQPMDAATQAAGAAYVNGILSVAYLKDSDSPTWDDDAAMQQYRSIVARYLPGRNSRDGQIYYGVAKAETFVQALYKAGKNPTRASLMKALLSLNSRNKFALPGVVTKTSAKDTGSSARCSFSVTTRPPDSGCRSDASWTVARARAAGAARSYACRGRPLRPLLRLASRYSSQ